MLRTLSFEVLLCLKGLLSIQADLESHMDVPTCMIDKDTASFVLVSGLFFAKGCNKSAEWVAVKVINRNPCSRVQIIGLECLQLVFDDLPQSPWCWSTALLGILTCGAHRPMS